MTENGITFEKSITSRIYGYGRGNVFAPMERSEDPRACFVNFHNSRRTEDPKQQFGGKN